MHQVARFIIISSLATWGHRALADIPADDNRTADIPATLSLSLSDAIARAKERAPDIVLANAAVRQAMARRVGAGIVFPSNPRVSVDARPPITGGAVIPDVGYAATLEVPFDVSGAPRARVREAEQAAAIARAELDVERLRVRSSAWGAYVRVGIAEQRVFEMQQTMAIAERVLSATKQRAQAGASNEIEESLASFEVTQISLEIDQSIRLRQGHTMDLRHVLDLPASQQVQLVTPVGDPPDVPNRALLVEHALRKRPELAVIKRRMSLLDATTTKLRRELFPRLGVYGGVDAAPISPIFGVVGLSVELPVAQRNQQQFARVDAERTTEMDRETLLLRRIVREVVGAIETYEARRRELRLLTDSALPLAMKSLELVEIGWRAGRFDLFRVTTAAREVARVRGKRLDALEAAWVDRIAIDTSVGGLDT